MLNTLVVEGPTDDCTSVLLLLISGFVTSVDSGDVDVEELENMNLVLVVMDISADEESEVAPVADTVEALSDDVDVVKLFPEVMDVSGGVLEEAMGNDEVVSAGKLLVVRTEEASVAWVLVALGKFVPTICPF